MGRVSAFTSNAAYESDEDSELGLNTEYVDNQTTREVMDISGVVRTRCMNYSEEGSYPLCEFLDVENVENYINWLLYLR